MSLPIRKIGNEKVSAIGYGVMSFGGNVYGDAPPDEERYKILERLIELDCTFWDTSDVYGDSEIIIGKYFKSHPSHRSQVFLATKFGYEQPNYNIRGDPEYIHQAIDKSLERLGVPFVDLYYVHRIDDTVPIEKTIGALAELVKQGKIRYIGLSEPSPNSLRRAHAVHPIAAIQVEYSPVYRGIEKKGHLLDTARELGIPIVTYSPVGRGILSGQFKSWADLPEQDFRKVIPRYADQNFPKILEMVDKLKVIASKYNATTSQIALAWLLAQGDDIIPIPGSKKMKCNEENLGAIRITLKKEDIEEVGRICEVAEKLGAHYDDHNLSQLYRDTPPMK